LGGIGCNKDCCEANTKHPKASKQAVVKGRNGSAKGNTDDDEIAAVLKEGHKSDFTKARSNEKGRGERVDHILNSM